MNELLTSNDVVVADPNIKSAALVGHYLRLTDANRGGIVLREKIFTLRSHSSITNLLAEAVDQSTFKLKVTAYLGNNYVRNDGNVFIADTDSAHAVIFHAKRTELGIELYYNTRAAGAVRPPLRHRHRAVDADEHEVADADPDLVRAAHAHVEAAGRTDPSQASACYPWAWGPILVGLPAA
jgi:hypothetical protein